MQHYSPYPKFYNRNELILITKKYSNFKIFTILYKIEIRTLVLQHFSTSLTFNKKQTEALKKCNITLKTLQDLQTFRDSIKSLRKQINMSKSVNWRRKKNIIKNLENNYFTLCECKFSDLNELRVILTKESAVYLLSKNLSKRELLSLFKKF